ncbi:DNA-3-methyladenine glycosylase, putative [Plasmodium knowlesi strain H]|uniref:DNA-3-methyladenine glycosylase II n=3 Tax=Plasmodium knowlesi TaxID=5850 RepID=A0A5K1VDW1_PLAKH|nr:DNA-3-methyladenine glycosylase, putative [Plasmodium knowlesi strain H]OTN65391.1 putative DNA-3-methyladenine glycosylase [Plasmodium knowlesi]CAA9989468.1 DNA-3-methyladenine glycosylase, putative [Plasmodium knowlesi strain H]SBO25120.1 DNA-3-methyladenine glycosylase, putative [Plasmodium knowlesi strain H]SBO27804.1 DNA-3-methyladenine glycosylase, putative [Plasmodium knowlesi strain H]VVS78942.1 DNA-3-methyladenine glycosylase, putative [Plasmodium knowlesi strain H]|eukprot:XP_002260194.1 DNA-3-methyladenine glycosylase, putative [Plasmodium knowlesi strain H]
MQNEKRCRKRRGSLVDSAPPAVRKKDRQRGTLKVERNEGTGRTPPPKIKEHKGEEEKRKKTNQLEYMAYVYLLMEYFFENNQLTVLNEKFYLQKNVLPITEALIGQILWVFDKERKKLYGSRITELEAYNGTEDRASHAYNNKKTNRNATMFGKGGVSYVYLCYGIHNCLNIVTNEENIPDAILVRSLEPFYGTDSILLKRYKIHSGGSMLGRGSSNPSACAVKGKGGRIPIGCTDEHTYDDSNYCMFKENLQRIEKVKEILKSINIRKIGKVCSGPGCVTKCLDITRKDDKESFFCDFPNYSMEGKNLTLEGKHEGGCAQVGVVTMQSGDATQVGEQADTKCIAESIELSEGVHPTIEGKNIKPDHCSTCNIRHLQKSRFFISVCPSTREIINFYEELVSQKRENQSYIQQVYGHYKSHLLDYFKCMKWDQEEMVVQRDKRVGVAYAQEAAFYNYRFLLKGHPSISVLPK